MTASSRQMLFLQEKTGTVPECLFSRHRRSRPGGEVCIPSFYPDRGKKEIIAACQLPYVGYFLFDQREVMVIDHLNQDGAGIRVSIE